MLDERIEKIVIDKASVYEGEPASPLGMEELLEEFELIERARRGEEKFEYEMPELDYLPDPDYFDN